MASRSATTTAADSALISFLKAVPHCRMRPVIRFPSWWMTLAAYARPARCRVTAPGTPGFSGPCRFEPFGGDGSFAISRDGGGDLLPGITDLSVAITAAGKAEVRGLSHDGIQSRWGAARRSDTDPACWRGREFTICAH